MQPVLFRGRLLPILLLLPQLAVTAVFFLWPAGQAVRQSVLREDPFGLSSRFVGLDNFTAALADPAYLHSLQVTAVFTAAVVALSMVPALLLALAADRGVRGAGWYKSLILWPYAVAPAVAGMIWMFLFDPAVGALAALLRRSGLAWNPLLDGGDAMLLVVLAAAWQQLSYNFLFFLAGLQSIPRSLLEAAALDGAGPARRFFTIILPLLSPTTFFLVVVNLTHAFFETFGIIHAVTGGGPAKATEILVYKVYQDGFVGLDLGGSAAQSVVLMILVMALTAAQFRWIERKVHYP
jgi:sn-glycerol 3-phosphate transport system permease protein